MSFTAGGSSSSGSMRVACLQLAPTHGHVRENLARADALLEAKTQELEGLSLLVLPEMAFTGYQFRDADHIDPHLEEGMGPTTQWCLRTAARLGCIVCCGLPRKVKHRRFNSMLVAGPEGVVHTYDKHHLYATDHSWAEAGEEGFCTLRELPGVPLAPVGLGVCMDINPWEFQGPDFAWANFQKKAGAKLLVFSSAWCSNHPLDPPAAFFPRPDEQVVAETHASWRSRLTPLLGGEKVYFVAADRVGEESMELLGRANPPGRDLRNRFCGSSCVMALHTGKLLGVLGASEEGVLIVDIPLAEEA